MGILIKIVYRNLREHKVKTFIIGLIVAFGMFILILGNSVIDTITEGVSKNFVDHSTGHIAIFPSGIDNPSLIGGGPESMEDAVVPVISSFVDVSERVRSHPDIVAVSPQINGMATMQIDEEGSGFVQLLGVDPELYSTFFPDSITLVAGRFLSPGEEGLVLSADAAEELAQSQGKPVEIGDAVVLTGTSRISGIKIREVPVVGIYDVTIAAQMMTSYLDGENMRALNGMTQITDVEAVLTVSEQRGLGAVDESALFGGEGDLFVVEEGLGEDAPTSFSVFGASDERELYNAIDPDAWHYLLVRLKNSSQIPGVVRDLNKQFQEVGLEVTAYSWIDAAGQVAEMTTALRLVFNAIIFTIAIVAVIIIMNTLVISVTERLGEIGTMRAIGAQKGFVRRMIILETIVIILSFGAVGILLGGITIAVIRSAGIETNDIIVRMLAGGSSIQPIVRAGSVLLSFIGMLAAGTLASLYPASVALRIQPRQAMAVR